MKWIWHSLNIGSNPSKKVFEENLIHTKPFQLKKENSEHNHPNNCVLQWFDWNLHKTSKPTTERKTRQKNQ